MIYQRTGDPFEVARESLNGSFKASAGEPPDPLAPFEIVRQELITKTVEVDPQARERFTLGPKDFASFKEPEYLIEGRLQKNSLAQLAGPSYAGKSFWALDAALRITTNGRYEDGNEKPWNLYGKAPAHVLYLAAEGVIGQAIRVAAWEIEHQLAWNGSRLRFRSDVPHFLSDDFPQYVEMIEATGPWDLIVVDTLARSIPGVDENNAEALGAVVAAAEEMMKASGGAVLLVHHFGWDGNRQRGSSALYGACDNIIYLTRNGRVVSVKTEKLKDGNPSADEVLLLVSVGPSAVLRSTTPELVRQLADEEAVLAYLRTQSAAVSTTDVRANAGINVNSVGAALGRLSDQQRVTESTGPGNARMWSTMDGNLTQRPLRLV